MTEGTGEGRRTEEEDEGSWKRDGDMVVGWAADGRRRGWMEIAAVKGMVIRVAE